MHLLINITNILAPFLFNSIQTKTTRMPFPPKKTPVALKEPFPPNEKAAKDSKPLVLPDMVFVTGSVHSLI